MTVMQAKIGFGIENGKKFGGVALFQLFFFFGVG